jgi:hypothetical protein
VSGIRDSGSSLFFGIQAVLSVFSKVWELGSVADPGFGAFLTPDPGSGIGFFRISDLRA